MILVCLTLPKAEKSWWSSASVVVDEMPPTNTLFGTRVPNLGGLLGMLMVVGFEPGLEEGDESMLPLDMVTGFFRYLLAFFFVTFKVFLLGFSFFVSISTATPTDQLTESFRFSSF